ncbi:MAG: NAD-dependent dehydratase [Myxococcaceae bacterium]|nr:NAD-dependent dehydratase [Myxococcaceae bacterium]
MPRQILITGSCGLVGRALTRTLTTAGYAVRGLDPAAGNARDRGDVRDADAVRAAVAESDAVLHLGAVSRVVWGERDPALCQATNVEGTRNVLLAAARAPTRPWVVVASSREVYGQATTLPVTEDAPRRPMNVYARSKVAAEELAEAARRDGVRATVVRLSNVYGCTRDHHDRVIPAFARAATFGDAIRVEGADRLYDFTHIDDVARGLTALVRRLDTGIELPPIHFVSGVGTTLGELASLATALAGTTCEIAPAPPRTYDVARFVGDPARASDLLDWRPTTPLSEGLARLITMFREEGSR